MSLRPEDMRKVGGSDIPAIMGMDPYRGPLSVWMRIVHGVQQPDNAAMRRGRALEQGVLDLYAEETGRVLYMCESVGIPSPWRASLDARSMPAGGGILRVVEAKTVSRNSLGNWGESGTDEVPDGYALQVQWYLGWGLRVGRVEDRQADVAALLAGDFALYHVFFDSEVFGVLEDRAARFWRDHVETGKPPEDAPLPADAELVKRIRRDPGPVAVHFDLLDSEARQAVREHLWLERQVKALEARSDGAKTKAMLAVASLGAGGVAGLPEDTGHSRIAWDQRKGGTKTDWEAVAHHLANEAKMDRGDGSKFARIVAELTKTSEPSRTWRPVPLKETK